MMSLPGGPNARHSLGEFPTLRFYEAGERERRRLREELSRFKRITIHQAWNSDWRSWIDCASYFGAELVTVHHPQMGLREGIMYLREMGDYAARAGIRIGVENAGGGYEGYIALIEGIDHPAVGATLDIGHCAYFEEVKSLPSLRARIRRLNDLIEELVGRLGGKLFNLHLHNVRASDWKDHRSLPDGVIDIPRLVDRLKAIGYKGLFVIELEEPEAEAKAEESGRYLSELLGRST